ncbi:MAG: hypothetical protein C0490_10430 [Marivirga sp.]|nr:hypothetical protein [Marivirga sp.]
MRKQWVRDYLNTKIDRRPSGPSDELLTSGKSYLWGKVWDDSRNECISTLETPNGYTLTAKTSVLIAEKIIQGNFKPGYQTPSMAYGADLILELENTSRIDR